MNCNCVHVVRGAFLEVLKVVTGHVLEEVAIYMWSCGKWGVLGMFWRNTSTHI